MLGRFAIDIDIDVMGGWSQQSSRLSRLLMQIHLYFLCALQLLQISRGITAESK
jgi:hypothetical protein